MITGPDLLEQLQAQGVLGFSAWGALAKQCWPLLLGAATAGVVDSIGGGGGLISVPTLLLIGVPAPLVLGTNKGLTCFGAIPAAWRYYRAGLMPKLAPRLWLRLIPVVMAAAVIGSTLAQTTLLQEHFRLVVPVLLCAVMVFMLKHWFYDEPRRQRQGAEPSSAVPPRPLPELLKQPLVLVGLALIGTYDGLFGPGSGTLYLSLNERLGLRTVNANAFTKVFNLASNWGAMLCFAAHAKILWPLSLGGTLFYQAGGFVGAGLVLKRGQGLVRVVVLAVTSLILVKYLLG